MPEYSPQLAPVVNDPRSVDELINAALCEPEDAAWDAVCALHWRGTREVLDRAAALCRSECPQERCLGADILGQLGVRTRAPELLPELIALHEWWDVSPALLESAIQAAS